MTVSIDFGEPFNGVFLSPRQENHLTAPIMIIKPGEPRGSKPRHNRFMKSSEGAE
jgi:hypothetical protein